MGRKLTEKLGIRTLPELQEFLDAVVTRCRARRVKFRGEFLTKEVLASAFFCWLRAQAEPDQDRVLHAGCLVLAELLDAPVPEELDWSVGAGGVRAEVRDVTGLLRGGQARRKRQG